MLRQSEIAGVGRRVVATTIDFVILHLALIVIARDMYLSLVGRYSLAFVIAVVYSAMFVGLRGQTPGKMALGLRVIDATGGGLDYVQTFRRAIVKWVPIFVPFVLMAIACCTNGCSWLRLKVRRLRFCPEVSSRQEWFPFRKNSPSLRFLRILLT